MTDWAATMRLVYPKTPVAASLVWLLVAFFLSAPSHSQSSDLEAWVLVDSRTHTLSVIRGGAVQVRFYGISIGRGGTGFMRIRGDAKTPVGEFHIAWVNRDSRYSLFFGLDFPNLDYAARAYENKLIRWDDYIAIRSALLERRTPPQDTQLGGYIGIHGIGRDGNLEIHQRFNWTDGCIALTDQQVAVLSQWVEVGTKVIIN